ncbi:hypothetical protein FOZ62_016822, partial [Perkinsus olseni]
MIICAELGDKTFFIAAILSMRHSAVVVFMGAIIAMATMTVLSAGLGLLLPALLSKKVTHYSCIVLFVYFGLRLLKDAYDSDNGDSGDLAEVEMSIKKKHEEHDKSAVEEQEAQIEAGEAAAVEDVASAAETSPWYSAENRAVLLQSFVMSFLAEWGDRSQISTIALASSKNPFGVMVGGILGHCICSGIAVVGGRLLASRISERQVAIAGGVLFLVFALSSLLLGVDDTASASSSMREIADDVSSATGDSTMDGSAVHHRSVRWEEIPQAVTMAALIDLMRRHGFDYGDNVRSINWPFDRGSPHGSAIIRFESHDLAKRFIHTFDGYTWSESATRSRLCWSPERIDQLPGALARPASSTAVVVRGVPSNCTYGNLHRFMKRFFGPVIRCKLGPRDGRSYRHVVCVFATVGAARSALKCSRMAAQGNRKSARVLKSLGGSPVTIEPHGQEDHWRGDDHSDTTEPSTPGGDSEPSDEAWTVDKTGYGDDSSDGSSPRKAGEETAGLLANPEPCATLMWYHVPHNCTPDKLMRLLLDYGCQLGPVSAYRSCDLIIDEYSNHAMVHCVSWEKARALMMALESFPGLLGEYGSMEVIDGRKDTLFLDAMEPCWGKDTNRTIVVLNMFTWLSRNEFIRIVSHFGDVRRALVRSYISCGRITTYGLCHFVHRAAASLAAEVGRVAPTELGVGYRTTLSMLGQRVRLKLLTWLVGNEWYFEMNRRRQQAQSWPNFQGYYYWSSEPMAPSAIEGPPTSVESEENK